MGDIVVIVCAVGNITAFYVRKSLLEKFCRKLAFFRVVDGVFELVESAIGKESPKAIVDFEERVRVVTSYAVLLKELLDGGVGDEVEALRMRFQKVVVSGAFACFFFVLVKNRIVMPEFVNYRREVRADTSVTIDKHKSVPVGGKVRYIARVHFVFAYRKIVKPFANEILPASAHSRVCVFYDIRHIFFNLSFRKGNGVYGSEFLSLFCKACVCGNEFFAQGFTRFGNVFRGIVPAEVFVVRIIEVVSVRLAVFIGVKSGDIVSRYYKVFINFCHFCGFFRAVFERTSGGVLAEIFRFFCFESDCLGSFCGRRKHSFGVCFTGEFDKVGFVD